MKHIFPFLNLFYSKPVCPDLFHAMTLPQYIYLYQSMITPSLVYIQPQITISPKRQRLEAEASLGSELVEGWMSPEPPSRPQGPAMRVRKETVNHQLFLAAIKTLKTF